MRLIKDTTAVSIFVHSPPAIEKTIHMRRPPVASWLPLFYSSLQRITDHMTKANTATAIALLPITLMSSIPCQEQILLRRVKKQ